MLMTELRRTREKTVLRMVLAEAKNLHIPVNPS